MVKLLTATYKVTSLLQCYNINKKKYEKFMIIFPPLPEASEIQSEEDQEDDKYDGA